MKSINGAISVRGVNSEEGAARGAIHRGGGYLLPTAGTPDFLRIFLARFPASPEREFRPAVDVQGRHPSFCPGGGSRRFGIGFYLDAAMPQEDPPYERQDVDAPHD